jgi:hypothetical protein
MKSDSARLSIADMEDAIPIEHHSYRTISVKHVTGHEIRRGAGIVDQYYAHALFGSTFRGFGTKTSSPHTVIAAKLRRSVSPFWAFAACALFRRHLGQSIGLQ